MIFIFIASLVCFGSCTPGGAVGGYGDFKDLLDGLKSGAYGVQHYEQNENYKNNGYLEEYNSHDDGYDIRDGYDDKKDNQREYEEYVYDKNHNKDCNRNDRNCYNDDLNLVGLGKNDREDQLIRPCAFDDRQCIRKYLAENSNCKPVYGPIPDPLYLKKSTLYFPFANLTVVRTRLRVTGLSSIKISEFYVNKDTKNLVIALDYERLNQTTPRAYIRYKRAAKESIVLADFASIEQKSGTYTAVIPRIPHLRLDLAEIHEDSDDPMPRIIFGPNAVDSRDPDVIASVARLLSNLQTTTQEGALFLSQLFTAIYIQENLCDFGLKLTSI